MLHILMYLLVLIFEVEAAFKMILIFGMPANYITYRNRTATISSCMDYCLSVNTCVSVYVEKGAKNCWVFSMGDIQKLRELSSTSGHKIAMKMEVSTTTCAKSFNSNSMKGSVTTDTRYMAYKITLGDDGRWIFTTTQVLICPNNYKLFTRPKGLWCIGVVSVNQCISQEGSLAKCKAAGGVLTGLQTMDETNYIYGIGLAALKKDTTYNIFAYWVNGFRKDSCQFPAVKSASCNGVNEFSYTDPLLSSYAGYYFADTEPSGIGDQTKASNCLNIMIKRNNLIGVDDNRCAHPNEGENICFKGYACGMKPIPQTS